MLKFNIMYNNRLYFFNIALKTRSHFRFFKTTYWRCARKCKVGLLETLGNYCALQYTGRCCGKRMCDSDAARTQRWCMWAVHCELLDRFDNHQLHKLTRWDFIRPRVIGITRHEVRTLHLLHSGPRPSILPVNYPDLSYSGQPFPRAPRVIGITRYEASVPAPSLAAERIHINALRAYGSYRFHGLAFELGFKCYKMRWMRWGQWCGYESSDSDSESDGAMPPLEQQEADPVDLPDLA